MDRHGKKAKAKTTTVYSERSDLKAKSRSPLNQIGLGARAGTDPRDAMVHGVHAKTERKPR
jgi:hypothetical protein